MPDSLAAVSAALGLADSGDLVWLLFGSVLAGLVRGFAGFGTAMIFLPFAASVMPPVWAVTVMVVMDITAPLLMAPRTAKDGDVGDVLRLGAGCLVGLPLGVAVLMILSSEVFRYSVSALTLLLLALLASGARFRGAPSRPMIYGAGGLGGILGGAVGIPGPPVIILYLASPLPASVVRANNFLYLLLADILLLGVFTLQGILYMTPLLIGASVTLTYFAGILAGTWAFNPDREKTYRIVAYLIIVGSALRGLPLFG